MDEKERKKVRAHLKECRNKAGLTAGDAALKSGLTEAHWRSLENDKRIGDLRLSTVMKIRKVLRRFNPIRAMEKKDE